jgi:hypothetical protein
MNAATATQLRLLREISDAFGPPGVRWWLFGGWAMDAHAGEVTRDHADIEIFLWIEDGEAAFAALEGAGFQGWNSTHADESRPFTKDGQEVGLWFLTRRADGAIVTPGRWTDWPWAAGAFDIHPERIGDLELPVMSLDGLLDIKTNFANHRHGAPLREKDLADIERLRSLLEARCSST